MRADDVGILCALALEARHFEGQRVMVTGMGSAAAAAGARALLDSGASALISWGMAGGLDPALGAGTIVLPHEVLSDRFGVIPVTREWRDAIDREIGTQSPVSDGRLLSVESVVSTPEQKGALFRLSGAAAIDMESGAIADVAQRSRVPFIAARVVVDTAHDRLPAAVTATATTSRSPHWWSVVAAVIRAPRQLGALAQLARRYQRATRSMAVLARCGALTRPPGSESPIPRQP